MGKKNPDTEAPIHELVDYLQARLETILANWRNACEADDTMSSKSSFSWEEFNDQVPLLITLLFLRLRNEPLKLDPATVASEHGLHRWQSGYSLPELISEMEHLFKTILDEVEAFETSSGKLGTKSLLLVQQQVFRMYGEANRGSLLYYHQLLQNDAAERARSLQFALDQLHQLGEKRGEHLRQSSHDLRTSFSIMTVASQLLEYPKTEKERTELMDMLNRNLSSIREMLLQLTDYARIEAGQDALDMQRFDVAKLVKETLETAQPLAKHNKLLLQGDGPEKLEVTGDRVKVQRILINLLYNALKYTRDGSVYVTWTLENPLRWSLSIQDTGPGFAANSPAALLAEQLKPNTLTSASHQEPQMMQEPPAGKADKGKPKESEGLGLFIVKKLCELMKASMDIESQSGKGTLVRIRFMMQPE
ncbi:sensor histidine kinase [Dyadobacter sp.]|uniref:sensor histidine kinase n=1 Tax=Dyadobacter sp. TaxID=1914288 RepID=UPI003F718463